MITEKTKKELTDIFDNLSPENADHFLELLRCTLRGEQVMEKKLSPTSTQPHQATV